MNVVEGLAVPAQRHAKRLQRFHLGRDVTRAVHQRVVQRLDAEPVAAGKEHAVALVPQRERELAAKLVHRACAEVLVEMKRDLAVGPGLEAMPFRLQLRPDPLEVVELAVDDDVDGVVFVVERLIAGGEVDDAQPRVAETRTPVRRGPHCLGIGTAVHEAGRRTRESVRGNSATR